MLKWPTKKLGEICSFQNGLWKGKKPPFRVVKVLRNTNFLNSGYLDLTNVAEIKVEERQLTSRLLQKGDLILERSGGGPTQPVGRVIYFDTDGEYSFSNFTTRIRVNDLNQIDPIYLWRYLNYLYISGHTEKLQKQTTGIRNLIFSEYKNLQIPLPPLSEQKCIVKKIEKLFAKIDEAEKLREEAIKDAENLLKSAMQEVFERGRENWPTKKLGEVAEIVIGKTPARSDYLNEGVFKVLKYRDISRNKISWENNEKGFVKENRLNGLKEVKEGDVLITSAGHTPDKIGEDAAIVKKIPNRFKKVFFVSELICYRPQKNLLLSEWLLFFLNSKAGQEQVKKIVGDSVHLTGTKSENLQIPLPPLSEQKQIVAYLDSLSEKVHQLKELQNQTFRELSHLRQSILNKAFKGELL